ncbi:hypothetical protein EF914_27860 [Streptomyces sp. WAC05458]|nr:hypothetical protein EF914_27860 [Streptomyces sp. WAC05458]
MGGSERVVSGTGAGGPGAGGRGPGVGAGGPGAGRRGSGPVAQVPGARCRVSGAHMRRGATGGCPHGAGGRRARVPGGRRGRRPGPGGRRRGAYHPDAVRALGRAGATTGPGCPRLRDVHRPGMSKAPGGGCPGRPGP